MALSSPVRQSFWTRDVAATILFEMEAYKRQVGARLRDLRKAQNWSQEDAAHAVGVTSATWGRWERGRSSPYDFNWRKIEEAFKVDAGDVRGPSPTPLALGAASNGDHAAELEARLVSLAELVSGLDEQLRLLRVETAARDAEVLKRLGEGRTPTRRSQEPPHP